MPSVTFTFPVLVLTLFRHVNLCSTSSWYTLDADVRPRLKLNFDALPHHLLCK